MNPLLKTVIAAVFAGGLATSVIAAPPGKGPLKSGVYKQASTQEEIQSIKKGDRYAVVCMECKSIAVKEAADEKEVEALCHDGGAMHCDSCKMKSTIKRTGPPGKGSAASKVTYMNEDGKECMFVVPVKD